MAFKQRNDNCQSFADSYLLLTDTKKNTFSRLCNKLLNDNFIYASKEEDRNDYYEILGIKSIIECYFSMIDFELVHVDTYKIFYLKTLANRNRLRLKKLDTVLLLILRLLYYKGSLNVNSSSDISTTLGDLITEVNQTGIYKTQISFKEYFESLKMLRKNKIIDFNFKEYNDDNVIVIYPTILYVVKIEDINMLNAKLDTYKNIKEDEDETDEDQTD